MHLRLCVDAGCITPLYTVLELPLCLKVHFDQTILINPGPGYILCKHCYCFYVTEAQGERGEAPFRKWSTDRPYIRMACKEVSADPRKTFSWLFQDPKKKATSAEREGSFIVIPSMTVLF